MSNDRKKQIEEERFKWVVVRNRDELEEFYESVIPKIRLVARNLGYALGEHGSKRRDLDVIAIPWIESAVDKEELARAIHKSITGIEMSAYSWEIKPCGRVATSFPVCFPEFNPHCSEPNLCHLDLSVIDLRSPAPSGDDERDAEEYQRSWTGQGFANGKTAYVAFLAGRGGMVPASEVERLKAMLLSAEVNLKLAVKAENERLKKTGLCSGCGEESTSFCGYCGDHT